MKEIDSRMNSFLNNHSVTGIGHLELQDGYEISPKNDPETTARGVNNQSEFVLNGQHQSWLETRGASPSGETQSVVTMTHICRLLW